MFLSLNLEVLLKTWNLLLPHLHILWNFLWLINCSAYSTKSLSDLASHHSSPQTERLWNIYHLDQIKLAEKGYFKKTTHKCWKFFQLRLLWRIIFTSSPKLLDLTNRLHVQVEINFTLKISLTRCSSFSFLFYIFPKMHQNKHWVWKIVSISFQVVHFQDKNIKCFLK